MAIGTKRYARGALVAVIAFFGVFTLSLMMLTAPNPIFVLVLSLVSALIGYRLTSRVTDGLAVQRALVVARKRVPNFVVGQHVIGVDSESGILLDHQGGTILVFDTFGKRLSVLPESALLACDVMEDGNTVSTLTTSRSSQLVGAAVGGLVFGGVGAVVGALSGKKKSISRNDLSEISLRLTVADRISPSYRITLFKVAKPVLKSSTQGRRAIRSAEEAEGLLQIIMQQSQAA
ncbi:hypothetical protein [Rhodoferax sp. WC2427]|uniref:hypothetical protein n=1 Tax=Rhodoferax sp. WC2427 TaxID=3234144 RepID=UPI003466BBEC